MENIFNLTPLQALFVMGLNAWLFVVFPVLIIKKVNYLTAMMEAHLFPEDQEEETS